MKRKTQTERIEELERRVRELEARPIPMLQPIYVPYPVYVPQSVPSIGGPMWRYEPHVGTGDVVSSSITSTVIVPWSYTMSGTQQ